MGALKGVGGAAIESIVEARKTDGAFQSLYDFCKRVDLRRVTKKGVEVLIKSGACDCFKMPKKGMYEAIGKIVGAAITTQKNEAIGQGVEPGPFELDDLVALDRHFECAGVGAVEGAGAGKDSLTCPPPGDLGGHVSHAEPPDAAGVGRLGGPRPGCPGYHRRFSVSR